MNLIKQRETLIILRKKNDDLNVSVDFLKSQLNITLKIHEKWLVAQYVLNKLCNSINDPYRHGLRYNDQNHSVKHIFRKFERVFREHELGI